MASTAVEKVEDQTTDLAPLSDQEQALADAARAEIDRSTLVLPALKLTQALTAEVQEGDAKPGNFINSLTGENYGAEVEVVISSLFKGRFFSDDDNRAYAARGEVAPDNWPEEYAGQRFVDLADSEERWKEDTNEGVHEWGSGPPISTTHNFVGYVVTDEGLPDGSLPVRISLMRTNNPAAAKLKTLIYALRAPWDRSFILRATKKTSNERAYYAVDVVQGSPVDPEVRSAAVGLAQDYANAAKKGDVELAGDAEEKPGKVKPKANTGGLDV